MNWMQTKIAVIGCGPDGAIGRVRGEPNAFTAVAASPRPILSTVGAGDALFAAFLDGHLRGLDPRHALARACLYAGWKIGARGAAQGLLTAAELDALEQSAPTFQLGTEPDLLKS